MTFTEGLLAMVAAEMKRRGRSQRAMAATLGVDHSTISLWLRGRRGLDGESVDRIVGFFGAEYIIESLREGLRRDGLDRGQPEPSVRREVPDPTDAMDAWRRDADDAIDAWRRAQL